MKTSVFKSKLLAIIIRPVLDLYEKELIPLFSNISKPAFQSKVEANDANPLQKYDWTFLYLDEEKLYEESKSELFKAMIPQYEGKDSLSDDISDDYAQQILILFEEVMKDFSFENDFEISSEDEDIEFDLEFFIKASIAQFHNSLSVIQNKKRINDLLIEFINNGDELILIKAVKVDPSVLNLQEVKDRINAIEPVKRNKLEFKLQFAKSIPHLTPDKRKKYLMLASLLDFTARVGFLSDPDPIPNKALQNIATELNLIPVHFDEDEFRKIASYYRNRPYSRG